MQVLNDLTILLNEKDHALPMGVNKKIEISIPYEIFISIDMDLMEPSRIGNYKAVYICTQFDIWLNGWNIIMKAIKAKG